MVNNNAKIVFNRPYKRYRLVGTRPIKQFLAHKVEKAGFDLAMLNYVFVNDEQLWKMNREFLGHDTYTDIITFDLSENPKDINGEIYISTDRVAENASHLAISFQIELRRVVFHGLLHLLGYKDKSEREKSQMRKLEDDWLRDFSKMKI